MTMTDKISDVSWESPPEPQVRYDWETIAEKLRERPMEWALIFERDRASIPVAIRQGSVRALSKNLGFEVRTANNSRGISDRPRTCSLYLRFNPDKVNPLSVTLHEDRKN